MPPAPAAVAATAGAAAWPGTAARRERATTRLCIALTLALMLLAGRCSAQVSLTIQAWRGDATFAVTAGAPRVLPRMG